MRDRKRESTICEAVQVVVFARSNSENTQRKSGGKQTFSVLASTVETESQTNKYKSTNLEWHTKKGTHTHTHIDNDRARETERVEDGVREKEERT